MVCMPFHAFMHVFILLLVALAMPWNGPTPTPEAGLMAMNGMSPRPTTAPDLGSVPRELLKRALVTVYPSPPQNWCGFEDGDYDYPVTCSEELYCAFSGDYGACCQTDQACTFTTSCDDTSGACTGSDCSTDVLYCPERSSYCASCIFGGKNTQTMYFCDTKRGSSTAEHIDDFYKTATVSSTSSPSDTSTSPSSTSISSTSSPSTTTASPAPVSSKGLAGGAVGGIAAGVGCLALAAVVGITAFFCLRHRRQNRTAGAQTQPQTQAGFNNHSNTTGISPLSQKPPIVGEMDIKTSDYPKPLISPANVDDIGMGPTLGHSTSNKQDQLHEVSGEPMHFQGQNQNQSQGQSQGIFHEVSAEPEPRYIAYSPTPSSQQESSYNTYTQSSVQDFSGTQSNTINDSLGGQRNSPGPLELPEQRTAH